MANRQQRRAQKHKGKRPGETYMDVLTKKKLIKEAIDESVKDNSISIEADIKTQRLLWMSVIALNEHFGFGKDTHTYLRGTNLKKKIVILDESQNYTVPELKKVLTRCHDTCKVIVIGHTGQIDIRGGSGFQKYLEHFQNQERCAVCRLTTNHRGWLSTYADELEE